MKELIFCTLFFMFSLHLFSQTDTVFLDKTGKSTTSKKYLYRTILQQKDSFLVNDFFLNHRPAMQSICSSVNPLIKNGNATYYYPNGKKKREGRFKNNHETGFWTLWEENENDSSIYIVAETNEVKWIRKSEEKLRTEFRSYYDYDIINHKPSFPEGIENYIAKNMQYPPSAKEKGIKGTVLVSFIISKEGIPTHISIVKYLESHCDAEARRLIHYMPHWHPGTVKGKPVAVKIMLPVSFNQ